MTRRAQVLELPGFEANHRRRPWRGNRLPVLYAGRRPCLKCLGGDVLELGPITQDALFYHGGYGASTVTTVDICLACAAVNLRASETARPPRRNLRP